MRNDKYKLIAEWLVYIVISLIGVVLVIIGFLVDGTWQNILLAIGTSFIASSVLYIFVSVILGDQFSPIVEKLRGSVEVIDRSNKTGLMSVYTHRDELEKKVWIEKIEKCHNQLDILGYAFAFLSETPGFEEILIRKVDQGCKIRILLGDPKSEAVMKRNIEEENEGSIAARIDTTIKRLSRIKSDNFTIRLHNTPLYCSVYRFDHEMYVTPHLYGLRGSAAPLLCLQSVKNGLFSSYEKHFNDVWEISKPIQEELKLNLKVKSYS